MAALARKEAAPSWIVAARDFCPQLLAEPIPKMVQRARKFVESFIQMVAIGAAKAASPHLTAKGRVEVLHLGREHLATLLLLLDALMRVPLRLLDAGGFGRHIGESAVDYIHIALFNAIAFGMTLDRAAADLGLPPWEGPGPFAVAPTLRSPRALAAGGAK